jgi:hypothetical protein
LAGLVWIVFALALCLAALQLVVSPENPNVSLLSVITPIGVGVAAAHVLGLGIAAFFSFVTGATLCACGLVPKQPEDCQGLFLS